VAVALRERAQLRQPLRDRAREAVLARDVRGQDHVPASARALGTRSRHAPDAGAPQRKSQPRSVHMRLAVRHCEVGWRA